MRPELHSLGCLPIKKALVQKLFNIVFKQQKRKPFWFPRHDQFPYGCKSSRPTKILNSLLLTHFTTINWDSASSHQNESKNRFYLSLEILWELLASPKIFGGELCFWKKKVSRYLKTKWAEPQKMNSLILVIFQTSLLGMFQMFQNYLIITISLWFIVCCAFENNHRYGPYHRSEHQSQNSGRVTNFG